MLRDDNPQEPRVGIPSRRDAGTPVAAFREDAKILEALPRLLDNLFTLFSAMAA